MGKLRQIKFTVIAKKWFDKYNGNTYHSVRCVRFGSPYYISALWGLLPASTGLFVYSCSSGRISAYPKAL